MKSLEVLKFNMTTALATLHSRLGQLRLRRHAVRAGLAWSALVTGVIVTLVVAFLVDWTLEMSRLQRFVSLVLCVGAVVWTFRKYSLPWLGVRESEVDLALIVERNQNIDSDLVAALQFERPETSTWGSSQLKRAVVEYVGDFSGTLNVFEGFSHRRLKRRLVPAGVAIVLALLAATLFPGHVKAFANRFLLGSSHYPSKTQIERIRIGQVVTYDAASNSAATEPVKSPHGQLLVFRVDCGGEIPEEGLVRLQSLAGNEAIEVPLIRAKSTSLNAANPAEAAKSDSSEADASNVVFLGELPRLVDSVSYQVYLGDAWTDPLEIHAIPLPVVTVELTPHPPKYAAGIDQTSESLAGSRQIAVLEGARVDLKIVCGNKSLKSAVVRIPELKDRREWSLESTDDGRNTWELTSDATPFSDVRQPLRYEIQVVDDDGLSLEHPLHGYIRLKADRPPRVAAAIVSRRVVPTAQPRIVYGAADDFGIARLSAKIDVSRKDGRSESTTRLVANPAAKPQTVVRGEYALDLAPLKLEKGDEIKITLEAVDYRGDSEPKSNVSEPLVLQVTDREGILAGLQEADEKSARQLDAIIQRELGIGESK